MNKQNKLVFVYSIPRPTATGLSDWTNDNSGNKLQKVKFGKCTDSIMALYSPKVGGLANYISYTPYTDPETGLPAKDENGEVIMLQQHLEKKWNRPAGYYTNRPFMKGDSLNPEDMTYFQKMSWRLNDGCTIFDLGTENGELGYYVILASHLVANSEREWKEHKAPKAQYYIALENESEQLKYTKNQLKKRAMSALADVNLVETIKRKMVSVLDLASPKATLTTEQVENQLFDYIESSTFTPGSNIEKFLEVYGLLESAHGKDQFEARYLLKKALDSRVVYEKQGTYTWVRPQGNLIIGDRLSEAIDFLLNPKKTAEVEEMEEQIKAKS